MKTKILILSFILLIFFSNLGYSIGPGASAGAFLKIPPTSRIIGLAESMTAIIDDPAALSINPAGLGNIDKLHILLSHYDWITDIGFEYIGIAFPSFKGIKGEKGIMGISIAYLHLPSFFNYGEWGDVIGDLHYSDLCVTVGYGQKVKNWNFGNSIKVLHQDVDGIPGTAVAFDVGAIYTAKLPPARLAGFDLKDKSLKFGIAILNIGVNQIKGYSTPIMVKLGVGSVLAKGFMLNMDFEKPVDNRVRINLGVEYTIMEVFSIRGGYRFIGYETDSFTLGAGVGFRFGERIANLGTSYAPQGPFKSTANFTIDIKFPGGIPEEDIKLANQLYYKGIYYYTQGDIDKAIQMWRQVLTIIPDHKNAIQKIKDAEYLKKLQEVEKMKK